jgi:outer membrane protein OmpA-like peptidoglycan-associated protein
MSSQSFHRLGITLLVVLLIASFGSACASKKFVREEVQASTRTLSTRIESNEGTIRKNSEQIQGNANQIAELSSLNKQNTQNIETVRGDVRQADSKAGAARTAANRAQQAADEAKDLAGTVDAKFSNRNNYTVLAEKFIYFKFNSARLEDEYQADLIEVAAVIKKNPDSEVILEGRTDQSGDPDYNVRLGERRLDSVLRYLVVEQAVPIHRIHKMSFGEAQPLADNETRDGRAKNRCTVIRVLAPSS